MFPSSNDQAGQAGAIPFELGSALPDDRVTADIVERTLYARDVAAVPSVLTRSFFRTLPDAVVRPANAEQVAVVLRQAGRHGVAVTPRAAASTSYYNAVPIKGGLVLDVNDLRGEIELDPDMQTVRVGPAVTWLELDEALELDGFAVKSYPSSAVAATIGGWVSTQGRGIGSLKHGALRDQLVSLQVVLPDGELRTITRETDPPLDWFVGAEGTLGVVTGVELSVRPRPSAEWHHLFAFNHVQELCSCACLLARSEPRPFCVFFADRGYLDLLGRAGFDAPSAESIILATFQGERTEVDRAVDGLSGCSGSVLPPRVALEEWNQRLYHLRTKRSGPSLLAAEQLLPLDRLRHYLAAVRGWALRDGLSIGNYGFAVTPELALVTSIYPADERQTVRYLAAMGLTKRLYDAGARCGGRPYGVGLWNTPYLPRLFGHAQLAELRQRKARLDLAGIMNPGKLYRAPFPLVPWAFKPSATVLSIGWRVLGRGRP